MKKRRYKIEVVVDGSTYTAVIDRGYIDIYRDNIWSGMGRVNDIGCILDCPADLGDDVYDALEMEIE